MKDNDLKISGRCLLQETIPVFSGETEENHDNQ
jgi:hypothetical protein